jgi:hypothetical protein
MWNSQEKSIFRATKVWKDFQRELREERKIDALTGKKLSRRSHAHHITPNEYDTLEKDRFLTLNSKSHSVIEFFLRFKDPWKVYERLGELLKMHLK